MIFTWLHICGGRCVREEPNSILLHTEATYIQSCYVCNVVQQSLSFWGRYRCGSVWIEKISIALQIFCGDFPEYLWKGQH